MSVMVPLHSPSDPVMAVGSNQILTTNERRSLFRVFTSSVLLLRSFSVRITRTNTTRRTSQLGFFPHLFQRSLIVEPRSRASDPVGG